MSTTQRMNNKVPVAITIAGSDSGGGAGIQADLKTFAALGVHGTTAITCITAQNTSSIAAVEDLGIAVIESQIESVYTDLGIDAGKTGMLHSTETIRAVSAKISEYKFPLVVDPVMVSKSGTLLLKPDALDTLKKLLIPQATIITPNIPEAEKIANMKIRNLNDSEQAAKTICDMGPRAVVIKGGHLPGSEAADLLHFEGRSEILTGPRLNVKTTHGTGCSFSAAITAEIAKGCTITAAVAKAKEVVTFGIMFGLQIGRGHGPVNPLAILYNESSRYSVLLNLQKAKDLLEAAPEAVEHIPEVGMNVAMAIPYARCLDDVAAIDGRIVKTLGGPKAAGDPRFGASSHLARYILEIMKHDRSKTAAINLRFSHDTLESLKMRNMRIAQYDRRDEPEEMKKTNGKTIAWAVGDVVQRSGKTPEVLYHTGDKGKEPMIVILGKQADHLAQLVIDLEKDRK